MITFKSKADVQTVEDVYAEVNARYIAALMFHDQMADYFDFLGLHGYKRIHEHQYYEESRERRKLNRYYINHHGRLIPYRFTGTVNMIPDGWLTANRISVGRSTKQKAVEDGFNAYREWEAETKKLYENYSKKLRDLGAVSDAVFLESMVEDVSEELKQLERIITDLISAGYDMVYVVESQKKLHDKYKAEEKRWDNERTD